MNREPLYEQTRISQKLREYSTLFLFIGAAAVSSIVLMDAIVFPLAIFSMKKPEIFTLIVKCLISSLVALFIIAKISKRIYNLRKEGMSYGKVFSILLSRRMSSIYTFIISLLMTLVVGALIYAALKYNYYLLYELIN